MAGFVRSSSNAVNPVSGADLTRMEVLIGPNDGAPNFIMRRFFMEPGGRIAAHKHPTIEHEQFIIAGQMTLGLDDEVQVARAGDAVYIPAGVAHWYENRGQETAEFLCLIPKTATYDTEWL